MSIRFSFCAWILLAVLMVGVFGCKTQERPIPTQASGTLSFDGQIEESLKLGRRLLAGGNPEAAKQIAEECLELDPESGQALMLAGQSAVAMDDAETGIELLSEAASELPEQWAELNAQIAGLLWQQDRLQEARGRLEELLAARPDFDEARRGLATLLNQLGNRPDANQQIRILSQRPDLLLNESELRTLIFPRRPEPELAELPKLDDPNALRAVGVLNVVRAFLDAGDANQALNVLRESDMLRAEGPAVMALLGQVLAEAGQFDELEKWVRQIVGSEQHRNACKAFPEYWHAVGRWALHREQPRQAVHLFAEAIRREPNDLVAYDQIVRALEASTETDAANRLKVRRGQIQSISDLVVAIGRQPDVTVDSYQRIAIMLSDVGRPFEARGWRMLGLLKTKTSDEVMRQANTDLAKLMVSDELAKSREVLLCGLNPTTFPLDLSLLLPDEPSQPSAPSE